MVNWCWFVKIMNNLLLKMEDFKMKNVRMLQYDLFGAGMKGNSRHAPLWLKGHGISYLKAVPQTMGDCWQFWGCHIPDNFELPDYVEIREDVNPLEFAGWGLSDEDAMNLADIFGIPYEIKDGILVGGLNEHLKKQKAQELNEHQQTSGSVLTGYTSKDVKISIAGKEITGYIDNSPTTIGDK